MTTEPTPPDPIGRSFSVVVFGNTDREHPIEDEIADAIHAAAEKHGFDVAVASGPYYSGGDERDLELAEAKAEIAFLREPKTWDFTSRFWGHNFDLSTKDEGQTLTGFIWSRRGPVVGDYLTLPNGGATSRYRVVEIEWTVNVDDMYRVVLRFAPMPATSEPSEETTPANA